ncbi:hypothetical protein E4U21_001662 [Claviceps maximensis]|nr:hypothetical protein E4U21_001662 [Claviceps maximensis]
MAGEPKYTDEGSFTLMIAALHGATNDTRLPIVQVIFKSVRNDSKDDSFLDRHVLLTKHNNKLDIGRSTKRDSRLAAKHYNGWFDSPVMSRNHARLLYLPKNDV